MYVIGGHSPSPSVPRPPAFTHFYPACVEWVSRRSRVAVLRTSYIPSICAPRSACSDTSLYAYPKLGAPRADDPERTNPSCLTSPPKEAYEVKAPRFQHEAGCPRQRRGGGRIRTRREGEKKIPFSSTRRGGCMQGGGASEGQRDNSRVRSVADEMPPACGGRGEERGDHCFHTALQARAWRRLRGKAREVPVPRSARCIGGGGQPIMSCIFAFRGV